MKLSCQSVFLGFWGILAIMLLVSPHTMHAEQSMSTVTEKEARKNLQELQRRFEERLPYQFSFLSEFELLSGTVARISVNQGEKPVTYHTVEGLVRLSGEKLETYSVSASLNNNFQKGTEKHSVWQDGRAFELRKNLESGREEAVTTRVKLHDEIRPDEIGWFADGVFIGSNHYSEDLLGVPELKIARETTIEGDELLRIEGEIPSGTMTAWLNLEEPVTLRRASFEASSEYLASEVSGLEAFELDVAVLQYTRIDDVAFPTKATATYTYQIPGEPVKLVKRLTTTRSEIQVNPDFDSMNAFQIDFPEGTILQDYSQVGAIYIWKNGELNPYIRGPDLNGFVIGPKDNALPGATVYIYTAKVKEGTSPYCPSCYIDCGKKATTDSNGFFRIQSLDPELTFRILTVCEGYEPVFVDDVDPMKGPIRVALNQMPDKRLAAEHTIKGVVLNPDGKPVVTATVEPYGLRYGELKGVDPLAVTNERGEFIITSEEPNITLHATVRARGLAAGKFRNLVAGTRVHELKLGYGATVRGRVLDSGAPVSGIAVGVVQQDRAADGFYGEYTIGTNKNGYFALANLPPNQKYCIYGKMNSLQGKGALKTHHFIAGGRDTEVDVGELSLEPGYHVRGRVVLSDGKPVPTKTRLMLSRQDAWDSLFCELDSHGRFKADDLPGGTYSIIVRVPDYQISQSDYRLDPQNKRVVTSAIMQDVDDFIIILEPEKAE